MGCTNDSTTQVNEKSKRNIPNVHQKYSEKIKKKKILIQILTIMMPKKAKKRET